MNKPLLFFFILIFLNKTSYSQSFNPVLAAKLQNTLDSIRVADNIKGVSACVFVPGEGTWKGVSGLSYSGFPITSDMEFGIGSNTKLFTAVLLLKLAENNFLRVDDSLFKWLPKFQNIDSNITIRQLLNHTSGIADINDIPGYADSIMGNPNRIFTPLTLLGWVGTPLFAPGSSWSYSNTNYILAGLIIERVTGKSYVQLLRDSILNPLHLDSTFLDVFESITGTIAHPWQNGMDINATPRKSLNSASWAAGAICSNAEEMVQWYKALLSGHVLSDKAFKELTKFVGPSQYGFGLAQSFVSGRTVWQHGGSIRGYTSQMIYDTTSKAIISVLVNANPVPAMLVAGKILSVLANNSFNGIKEIPISRNSVSLSPNPSSLITHVDADDQKIITIKIYNAVGKLLHEQSSGDISVSGFEDGIYYLSIETDKGIFSKKLIKE